MMNKVVIRRCPVCGDIGARAREVQATLSGVPGLSVEVADGEKGEFTVLVDRQTGARKGLPVRGEGGDGCQGGGGGPPARLNVG